MKTLNPDHPLRYALKHLALAVAAGFMLAAPANAAPPVTIAPADLPAWKAALSKAKTWNHFSNDEEIKRVAPKKAQPWRVSGADLGALEFYSPHSLTGSANGWVGIAPDGRIFVHTFAM
jgi:hypothetical protein